MKKIITILIAVVFLAGCLHQPERRQRTDRPESVDKLIVAVSILPQVDIVEAIGGEQVEVFAMIEPGYSPATYDPASAKLKQLSRADLYIRIGEIGFEETHLDRLQEINPWMKVVNSSEGVDFRKIESHAHIEADEEDEADEEEATAAPDPHIWLDPGLVEVQAGNIRDALAEAKPQSAGYFDGNLSLLLSRLQKLDMDLSEIFADYQGPLLTYHPAFGYLADAYGFEQVAVEVAGREPTVRELSEISDFAMRRKVGTIFIEEQFSDQSARVLARRLNLKVVSLDPLPEDYFDGMIELAQTIIEYE